jgi:hypothetical protein
MDQHGRGQAPLSATVNGTTTPKKVPDLMTEAEFEQSQENRYYRRYSRATPSPQPLSSIGGERG